MHTNDKFELMVMSDLLAINGGFDFWKAATGVLEIVAAGAGYVAAVCLAVAPEPTFITKCAVAGTIAASSAVLYDGISNLLDAFD